MNKSNKLGDQNGHTKQPANKLSAIDEQYLASYEDKCKYLRDRAVSIAQRYQNGLYVVGLPGTGKTHVIRETLDKTNADYVYRNGHMTPMGLYEQLELYPKSVMVIDDIPALLADGKALQILMAALGGELGRPRTITYSTKSKNERGKAFEFSGGIIVISNVPLRGDAQSYAIVSRCVLVQHNPTEEELQAVMRDTAASGFEDMSSSECHEVVEFVLDESRSNDYRLDLRFMRKGFQDYRQWKHGNAILSWEDLIRSSMKLIHRQRSCVVLSKQEELERDREKVWEAGQTFPGDTQKQIAACGLKKTKFYALRKEVGAAIGS